MVCRKCGYKDLKEVVKMSENFCRVCVVFVPEDTTKFEKYISEKIDWRSIDSFRRSGQLPGVNQKKGMQKKASGGGVVTRAPLGYDVRDGLLVPNLDSAKVHSLFKSFLNDNYSLNTLSKNNGLSVNGLKKILKNRTYLGEIKFDSKLYKANHKPLLSPAIFYAVQRKLQSYLRPRKAETNKYVLHKTMEPFKEKGSDLIEEDGLGGLDTKDEGDEVGEDSDLYKPIFNE
jgi:hypothetical protein